jgi:hypothetical protein
MNKVRGNSRILSGYPYQEEVHELVLNTRIDNDSAVFTNDHAEHALLFDKLPADWVSHDFFFRHQESVSTVTAVERCVLLRVLEGECLTTERLRRY